MTGFLPDILFAVSERFGIERALDLADKYGGRHVYMPAKPTAGHKLAKSLGLDLLLFLTERQGPGEHLIPIGPTSNFRSQQRLIIALLKQGKTAEEVARLAKCHVRTVYKYRARIADPANSSQLSLFETPDITQRAS